MAVSSEPFVLPRTGIAVANRCVLAAMTNKQSHEDGSLSDEEIHWLTMRAKGGFGIVTTAAANVTETGRGWDGEMGVWGDHQLPGLTKMAEGLRAHGALSLVQIFHGGMRAPQSINGVQPVSASVNTEAGMDGSTRALSSLEVDDRWSKRLLMQPFVVNKLGLTGLNYTVLIRTSSVNFSAQKQTADRMNGAARTQHASASCGPSLKRFGQELHRTFWCSCAFHP
jgi:hypothetical protein